MSRSPTCATLTTPVVEAATMMAGANVGSLPVVTGDRLVGIVTDRDIVTRVVAAGLDPHGTNVGEIASADPVCTSPNQDLDNALSLMAHHRIRRLPVVEDGELVGMIAQADVALETKEKETGAMVEEISRPGS